MITSFIEMFELTEFGHMTISTTSLKFRIITQLVLLETETTTS